MRRVWLGCFIAAMGLALGPGESFAAGAKLEGCSQIEVSAAKGLAAQVTSLSKTNPEAALKIAENVASTKSSCFQLAFGTYLDGTGTASTRRGRGGGDDGRRGRGGRRGDNGDNHESENGGRDDGGPRPPSRG
jgi:hypothetical protein